MAGAALQLENKQDLYEYKHLDWDSDYFGVSSGRITLKAGMNDYEWYKFQLLLKENVFNVIDNINNDAINNFYISKLNAAFVTDINFQFTKAVTKLRYFESRYDIYVQNNLPYNKEIVDISNTAYKHSRFFNDPFLDKDKAMRVYCHWVESSFLKTEKYFVICKEGLEVLGYLLFSIDIKSNSAIIELISTRDDMSNKAVGKEMMRSLEIYLRTNFDDIQTIKVGTQSNNINAINFYVCTGFSVKEIRSIYHYWNKK